MVGVIKKNMLDSDKEKRLCRLIIEGTNDAIIVIDATGHVAFWNKAATRIFGWGQEHMVGNNVIFLIPEEHRDAHSDAFARIVAEEQPKLKITRAELEAIHKTGKKIIVDISLSIIQNGDTYFVAILRDITEKRKAQAEAVEKARDAKLAYEQSLVYAKALREIARQLENTRQKEFWEDVLEALTSGRKTIE